MFAHRLTTILPAMRLAEALVTIRLHSVAGFRGWHGDNRLRLDIGDAPSPACSVHLRALFRPLHDKPKGEMMSIPVRQRSGLVNLWHLGGTARRLTMTPAPQIALNLIDEVGGSVGARLR
jgi:hypothetical protein